MTPGNVQQIISDPGTQRVGASKEIKDLRNIWNKDELIKFGVTNNSEWTFIMADSQYQNKVIELTVKQVKAVQKSLV